MALQGKITEQELQDSIISYIKIFATLILLTLITFAWPVFIDLDIFNIFVIQFLLALGKAYFIVAYLMHLKAAPKLIKTIVMCAVSALLTFFFIVGIDSNMDHSPRDLFQTHKMNEH
jgi:caa(3)-type oxidase subunit IV